MCRDLLLTIPEHEKDELLRRKGVNHIPELVRGSEPTPGRRGFVDAVSIPQHELSKYYYYFFLLLLIILYTVFIY
jgi:hypothetical protein